jgi:sulfide dehydrogenase [flavocytochrome c] flavoprotein subunit
MTTKVSFTSRRNLLLMASAAIGTGMIPMLSRSDSDGHDNYDSENKYRTNSNTTYSLAQTGLTAKVVVVGGGMAGATVAKYLRLWGGSGVNVTLVEPNASYTSNIMSNLVLNGTRTVTSLGYGYSDLTAKYGINLKQASVTSIDSTNKQVTLSDNSVLSYDRLVLAPGVEFMDAYGLIQSDYDTKTPHAWQAGPQTDLLKTQLAAMPMNGTFVMTIPKAPYRCPPGPYERACLVADYLKTYKGAASKVVVLDENLSIQAEAVNFGYAFNTIHAGVIDYRPGVTSISVNPDTKSVSYIDQLNAQQSLNSNLVSPIPPHRARGSSSGGWLANTNLNNSTDGKWCVVDVLSYESTSKPNIHIIGDAASCGLPKAGHVANQEAKICADAIVCLLGGQQVDSSPVANSACFSPITASTASWLTAVYQYDSSLRKMLPATNGGVTAGSTATEAGAISNANYRQMNTWFNTLMSDSYS